MKFLKTIRGWFTRKRNTEDLLRGVIYAGFWSNDGVCHYCGRFSTTYNEHHAGCLAEELITWAKDNGIDPDAEEDVFLEELIREPREPLPPERPQTAEEIAEAKKRSEEVREALDALRTTYNHHVVEPVNLSDEESAKLSAQYAPHDYSEDLHCRRCGAEKKEYWPGFGDGRTHCEIKVQESPPVDGS